MKREKEEQLTKEELSNTNIISSLKRKIFEKNKNAIKKKEKIDDESNTSVGVGKIDLEYIKVNETQEAKCEYSKICNFLNVYLEQYAERTLC